MRYSSITHYFASERVIMLKKTIFASVAALLLAACGGEKQAADTTQAATEHQSLLERINNHGTVTVGTEGTYTPFTYHDEAGNLTGYDVEVARAVADKLGVKLEFKETQWDAMLAGLKAERFDMVANQVSLTTPERRATFDKSTDYSYSGAMAVVRADDDRIHSLSDFKGLASAQSLSSNYGEMAEKAGAKIVPVDGMAQALALVQQKRADFTFNDSLALLDYLKKNPDSGLKIAWRAPETEKLGAGLILNKGNDEALAKINAAVESLHEDGTLKKLGEQFFGEDVSVQ